MVLSQGPGGAIPIFASDIHRRKRMSKGLMIAIGVSAAVHVGGGTYLYLAKMGVMPLSAFVEGKPLVIVTYKSPPPETKPVVKAQPAQPVKPRPTTLTNLTPPSHPIDMPPVRPGLTLEAPDPIVIATPPPEQPRPRTIGNPAWMSLPTPEQMEAVYPRRALILGQEGLASLTCTVSAAGRVRDCRVSGETPAGNGFGEAAMRLTPYFRMKPLTVDGQPVDGAEVTIPLRFKLN